MKEIRCCDNGTPTQVLPFCHTYGVGIEVQGFHHPLLVNSEKAETLCIDHQKLLSNLQSGKSLHAPAWDLNLGSKTPLIKEATMQSFQYAYCMAKALGCTEIIVHNGYVPNTSFYDGWVKAAVEFWQEFFSDKDDSITMMIENQCEEDSEIIKMEIDAVNDPRLKVCLDIGHCHSNSLMKVEDWITTLGNRIGYVHLHNNHGKVSGRRAYINDEHLGLQNGTINIPQVLLLLEQEAPDAIWSLECKIDEIEDSLKLLKNLHYL